MVYGIVHFVLNDFGIPCSLISLHKINKKRSEPTNEYGSK